MCGQRLRGNINSVPQAPNWCGPYFKRPLSVLAYLGETHDTVVGSPKRPHKTSNHMQSIQPVGAGGTIVPQRPVSYKKRQQEGVYQREHN